jgi:hypothetical protein
VVLLSVSLVAVGALRRLDYVQHGLQPQWLALGITGFGVLTLFGAGLWRNLLHALGPSTPRVAGTWIWCASSLGRYVPTSLLMPVMRMAMCEREGVPKRICLASMVYELSFALTAGLAVGGYFVVELPALSGDVGRFAVVALPIIALVLLQPSVFQPLANRILTLLGREPLELALGAGQVLKFVCLYAAFYIVAGLSVYALAKSIYPVGTDDLATIVGGFAASTSLSLVAFVFPGGLVAREAAFVVALQPVMPTAPAIALAIMARLTQLGVEVAFTATGTLIWRSGSRLPDRAAG